MTVQAQALDAIAVLPQACTPCMGRLDARPWHRTLAVRTGDVHSGVRVNTPTAEELVSELLEDRRAPAMDRAVLPNFSVEVHRNSGSTRALHLVYRDHEIVSRRRDIEELMADLVELLDEPSRLQSHRDLVVHATGVLTPQGAVVLLPGSVHKGLLMRREQLRTRGLDLLRTRTQSVDALAGEVVLEPRDPGLAQILADSIRDDRRIGRFPLEAWCVPAASGEGARLSRPVGVFSAYGMVLNRSRLGSGTALRMVADLAPTAGFWQVPTLAPPVTAAWLGETFGGR